MIGLELGSGPLDVVCLGAHPDDVEIGCGGTLLRLAERDDVTVRAVLLTGTEDRLGEARAALDSFVPGSKVDCAGLPDGRLPAVWGEVKEYLEQVAEHVRPDVVLAPRVDDAHQDHRLVGRLASTVWRDSLVLHYEIPKWDGDLSAPTHYVGFDEATARRKVELLHAGYPSQTGRDWWDDELFLGLMRVRGVECRSRYAEGFYASKVLIDPSVG
ncbi:GlcNAc-PI de-N-acetylase [Mumia flava]|uniref:GlcNAc-PI de-N-acetylase n=2 Tax=Mumia flava TaxID=1348852 RepID=A0A0B2B618_9ACTN|nr:GlcNAc-PI de-N-acetylase [Mumia flava]